MRETIECFSAALDLQLLYLSQQIKLFVSSLYLDSVVLLHFITSEEISTTCINLESG